MIVGVSFEIPQETTNVLWKILSSIDISKYFWCCDRTQTEVWDKTFQNDFFNQEYYTGDQFSQYVQNDHRIVFLKIQAHFSLGNFQNIHLYNEFVNSDCQILVLIYDCENVEIYMKNPMELLAIFENAKANDYQNVAVITDSNITREKMDIM